MDAVLHAGEPLRFSPAVPQATGTAVAIELLTVEEPAGTAPLRREMRGTDFLWEWAPVGHIDPSLG